MNVQIKREPKSQVVLTIEIGIEEMQPHLERAVAAISKEVKFEGFRPGHAPYDIVKARVGEMKIYETAAEHVVRTTYPRAVLEEKLTVVGQPAIEVVKLAPGNPFVYKATATLLPSVQLPEYGACRVERKAVAITDADVDRTLQELQKMQTREEPVDRASTRQDKIIVDMKMSLDRVAVDGGEARDHAIVLSESYYIPRMTDELLGMKAGETKEFSLPFPKEHYQKNLAGRMVDFHVAAKSVVELTPPPLDDTFAARLGQKTIAELRELLQKNLEREAVRKEEDRQELSMLEQLVERARFSDIPDLLVTNEAERMVQELEANIRSQVPSSGEEGGDVFENYLASIKKTRGALRLDFAPEAVKRVKTTLLIRAIAEQEKILVTEEDVENESEAMLRLYPKDAETQERIRSEEGQDYIRGVLRNRKVIAFLKEEIVR